MPFAVAVLCAAGLVVVAMQSAAPVVVQQFYSRVYNLPAKNVWGMTWPVGTVSYPCRNKKFDHAGERRVSSCVIVKSKK